MTNVIAVISVPDDDESEVRLPEDVVEEIITQGLAATMQELEYQIYRVDDEG